MRFTQLPQLHDDLSLALPVECVVVGVSIGDLLLGSSMEWRIDQEIRCYIKRHARMLVTPKYTAFGH